MPGIPRAPFQPPVEVAVNGLIGEPPPPNEVPYLVPVAVAWIGDVGLRGVLPLPPPGPLLTPVGVPVCNGETYDDGGFELGEECKRA